MIVLRVVAAVCTVFIATTTSAQHWRNGCYAGLVSEYSSTQMNIYGEVFARPAESFTFDLPATFSYREESATQDKYDWPDTLTIDVPEFSGLEIGLGTLQATGHLEGIVLGCRIQAWQSPFWFGFKSNYLPQGEITGTLGQSWQLPRNVGTAGYEFVLKIKESAVLLLTTGIVLDQWRIELGAGVEGVCGEVSARAWVSNYSAARSTDGCGAALAAELSVGYLITKYLHVNIGVRHARYLELAVDNEFAGLFAETKRSTIAAGLTWHF